MTASFSTTVTRGSPATYSARLEAFSSKGSPASLPLSVAGRFEPGRITVDPAPAAGTCSNPAFSAIPGILRALVVVPSQLSHGMSWTDSTDSSVCSGPIPVTLTSVRLYRVVGETKLGGEPVLVLEQELTTRFAGEGAEGQHRIRLAGEGSGRGRLHLNLLTGGLVDSMIEHTSNITVTASGRDQQFTQQTRELIQRSR